MTSWQLVSGMVVATTAVAIGASAAFGGLEWGHGGVFIAGVLLIAALERYPVAISPGRSGRLYRDITELGIGVLLVYTSPAALGIATAVAHIPLLVRRELPGWKRAFGLGQIVLASLTAGEVHRFLDDPAGAVIAAGAAHTAVLTLSLVAITLALGEGAIAVAAVRGAPLEALSSVAAMSAGVLLAQAMASPDWALLGVLGAVGVVLLVRVSHETALEGDRLRVLFGAATEMHATAGGTEIMQQLQSLGPLVVPGASLEYTSAEPEGAEAVRVGDRGWLTVVRSAPGNRASREDRKRLELLAALTEESLRRAAEMEAAERAAVTDGLTGLLNRRGLERRMNRIREPATVVVIDLDGLKQINDQHGHPAGDVAIIALANALRSGVRAQDLVARLGGDEFVVVIVGQGPDEVRPIVERLAKSANSDPNLEPGVRVRASLGAALWTPGEGNNWKAAVAQADKDLYATRTARGIPSRNRK